MTENHRPPQEAPLHPGEYLALEVQSRQESQQRLAEHLECSEVDLQNILSGKTPITPLIAYKLQQCWGISMTLLLDIQREYDTYQQKVLPSGGLAAGSHTEP